MSDVRRQICQRIGARGQRSEFRGQKVEEKLGSTRSSFPTSGPLASDIRHLTCGFWPGSAPASAQEIVFEDRPQRAEAVAPTDFLSFRVGAAVVADADFVDHHV